MPYYPPDHTTVAPMTPAPSDPPRAGAGNSETAVRARRLLQMKTSDLIYAIALVLSGAFLILLGIASAGQSRRGYLQSKEPGNIDLMPNHAATIEATNHLIAQHEFSIACYCMLLAAAKNPALRAMNAEASVQAAREEYMRLYPKSGLFTNVTTNTP